MEKNQIITWDCIDILRGGWIADKTIDLLCVDPPYEFISKNPQGGWFMKKEHKKHLDELNESFWMSYNPSEFLELIKSKLKVFNAYIRTNKTLVPRYIEFAEKNWYKREILLWLKSNPVPINNWHYLIDKEYCIYIKESWATFNSDLWYKNYFTYETYPIGNNRTKVPIIWLDKLELTLFGKSNEIWKGELDEQGMLQKNDILEWINDEEKYLNMLLYGINIMEKYLNECKSTTKMGISKITIYQTLNCLHHLNIKEGTHDAKKYDELYTSHVESAENWNLLTVTIKEKMESAHDVENAVLRMQLKIREKEKYVWHPTQKPLEMIERLIKISSNEWDLVLDCYLWSGTTAVACKNTNRNFIGIEINPEYVEIAKNRLKEVDRINQQRLF